MLFASYSLTLSLLLLLLFSLSSLSSSYEDLNSIIKAFDSSYQFSQIGVVGNLGVMAIWWTPDEAVQVNGETSLQQNALSVAVLSVERGYLAIGFNGFVWPNFVRMIGVAVVGIPSVGVGVYGLNEGSGVTPLPNIILQFSEVGVIENFSYMNFVWNLTEPNSAFNFSTNTHSSQLSVIFSTLKKSNGQITKHDIAGGFSGFDLKNNTGPSFSSLYCNCKSYQLPSNKNVTQCPCTCPGKFLSPNCTTSSFLFNVTLFDNENSVAIATIYWKIEGNDVIFDVQAEGPTVWFAIGFANSMEGLMQGTRAVILKQEYEVVSKNIVQQSADGLIDQGALPINVNQSWVLENGYPGFEFSVSLADLGSETVDLVAVGSPDQRFGFVHKYYTQGAYVVNLRNGNVELPGFIWSIRATHGLLMYIAWVILLPFGYLWARYSKSLPHSMWFEGHRLVMTTGFVVALCSTCVAFSMTSLHFSTKWHAQLGLTALCLLLFQICSGILRPHLDANEKTLQRKTFEVLHHLFGRLGIIFAWITIYGGLMILLFVSHVLLYVHIGVCLLWILIHLILVAKTHHQKIRKGYLKLLNVTERD